MNAADALLARGLQRPDKAALLYYDGVDGAAPPAVITYRAITADVERTAALLSRRGAAGGGRIILLLQDSPLFCSAFLGAVKAGAVALPLNTRLARDDYAHICADSGASLAIVADDLVDMFRGAAATAGGPEVVAASEWARALCDVPTGFASVSCAAAAPAFWLYSSGTTGRPKAILHSHAALAQAGMLMRQAVAADESSIVLCTSRLFFAFALDNGLLGPLSAAATVVLNAAWADPATVALHVARHHPTVFLSVPSFFRRLLALDPAELAPFADVRHFYTAGERVPDSVSRGWQRATGHVLAGCYGLSETFCNVAANFPRRERAGSCGQLLAGVEAKLLDRSGAPVQDEPGVLWVRHPTLALRYLHDEANARAFRDGWFCTGDLFTVDADGYYWHQGRADDLIKVAGQWVNPAAVEDAALQAREVHEAACVVVPDSDGFERLALFVVPAAAAGVSAADAAARAMESRMPRHAQPRWIREIPALPRTPTGKVQRYKLRELFIEQARNPPDQRARQS